MREQIHGTTTPVLSVHLEPGESIVAEAGEFSWMTDSIQMSSDAGEQAADPHWAGGAAALLSTYTADTTSGTISFAAKAPGSILPVDVMAGSGYLVHRRGFVAGSPGIEIAAGFRQSFRTGIFASEGFVLQRIGGQGRAWVELSGEVIRHDLEPGQSLRVHPGHVGMFADSVSFQIVRVPGIVNRYFGGNTHHFAVLTGPGTVWLQSMPLPQLAASLGPFLPGHEACGPAGAGDAPPHADGGLVTGAIGEQGG